MRRRVTRKQQNSSHCFVCGLANAHGLRAAFFEVEGGEVAVAASGRFLKMPIHRILEGGAGELGWAVRARDDDPLEFELPEAAGGA